MLIYRLLCGLVLPLLSIGKQLFTGFKGGLLQITYNLLISSGTHTSCVLEVCDLRLKANYVPGTSIAIAGKVL